MRGFKVISDVGVFLALFPPQAKRGQVKRSKDRVSKLCERH